MWDSCTELMLVIPHANFWPKWVIQWLKLIHGNEIQDPDFGDFPIQIAKNSRKRPFFDESYLDNRLELGGKWAHFGKGICRATTCGEMKENLVLNPRPPPLPLMKLLSFHRPCLIADPRQQLSWKALGSIRHRKRRPAAKVGSHFPISNVCAVTLFWVFENVIFCCRKGK